MAGDKLSVVHYNSYLRLDEVLNAQTLRSEEVGAPAHDEMLFIIIHQVYELWFKQIIHELSSINRMFIGNIVDERNIGIACSRLDRIVEIQKLLVQQIAILETMTALDFLDFRNYLFPASGFQSFQFRQFEVMLGLKSEQRSTYNQKPFEDSLSSHHARTIRDMESGQSLFDLVEDWLERTPFLHVGDFDFVSAYQEAVNRMLEREHRAIDETTLLNESEKAMRHEMVGNTNTYFQNIFDPEAHTRLQAEGKVRLSYQATLASLFISLYRDEPILRMPFQFLSRLMDVDELLTTWRYRHSQMVLRMLGRKIGTGGSSGYDYLQMTAARHSVFQDYYNLSTLLIPRSELPELPESLKAQLGFHYQSQIQP